jgi:hypothetical protein
MRTVRCVSPHGGAHHGLDHDDHAVPEGYSGPLKLPPNEGGWVDNAHLGYVRVGDVADAPEAPEFIADGFHFVDAATGEGDTCSAAGDGCWCGQHRALEEPAAALPPPPAATPNLPDLLGIGAR